MLRITLISLWVVIFGTEPQPPLPSPLVSVAIGDIDPDHAAKMAAGLELFRNSVRPVLADQCLKCHGGETIESEFDLVDRDRLLKGGANGAVVVLGKPAESRLVSLVRHDGEPKMPLEADKLSAEAIASLTRWIELGAPYDEPLVEGTIEERDWTRRVIPDQARSFWSFRPLARVEPPSIEGDTWSRTPVDRFLLARLREANLAPNEPADKTTLLRRVTLDLIGLPPTPAEIDAFIADTDDDALDKVVDRLLQSPHHGERWARHWLDIVRFGESHGFEHDTDRPSAYHYRDFVIKALNADMPFDQFVRWQIAGDELAPTDPLALMATGFLGAGVHSTQITKAEVEKHRYDEMDDMLATIGTSMLGLTIGCARCHDHKYDPIPQRDYYRMLSTFTTTIRGEVELDLDPESYRRAKEVFDAEQRPLAEAVRRYEADLLPQRLAAWEASRSEALVDVPWRIVVPSASRSEGGTTFIPQPDGSLLAAGTNAKFETYTFEVRADLAEIRGLRLEALSDPSLVNGGPGRAANGNFDLTGVQVTAASAADPAATRPIALTEPRATFEQNGFPIAAALDADERSGWAVDPEFGKDHAASFRFAQPVGHPGGTILTVSLVFRGNDGHNIGRPRLSLSASAGELDPAAGAMPESAASALAKSNDERTAEETAALLAWFRTIDPEWKKLDQVRRAHLAKEPKPKLTPILVTGEGVKPMRLHTQGEDFFQETFFLRRGETNQKLGRADQGFLQILTPAAAEPAKWLPAPRPSAKTSLRRTALANWLVDVERGAGSLLARVIVNRLWQHHLGRGIVATPSDFGLRGEPPTHPELLEWLAAELVRGGWRLAPIHRLILTSAAYHQSSRADGDKLARDRDNRLFGRWNARRIEAEAIRDSVLFVTGTLDPTPFGPGTLDPNSRRRGIYFTVKRSQLVPMMQVFDAPDALTGMAQRATTTIAPQALYLLNNPAVREQARAFAKRIAPSDAVATEDAVSAAYRAALARAPSDAELDAASAFIERQAESYSAAGSDTPRARAMTDFCQAVLCLNEFVYVQ